MRFWWVIFCAIAYSLKVTGQVWTWPEKDSAESVRKVILYTDELKAGRYMAAAEPLEWLLMHAPDLNPSLYINGVKIYQALSEENESASLVSSWQSRTLELYDLRIYYFGDEVNVLPRKSLTAYQFWRTEPAKHSYLRDLLRHTLQVTEGKTLHTVYLAYMDVILRMNVSERLTERQLLEEYDWLTTILTQADGENGSKEKTLKRLEEGLLRAINLTCEIIEEWLFPHYLSHPQDTLLARKLVSLILHYECMDHEFFLTSGPALISSTSSVKLARWLAAASELNDRFSEAENYYRLGAELAHNPEDRYDMLMLCAKFYQRMKDFPASRVYARKALAVSPEKDAPYELIGDLYYSSYEQCKEGISIVEDRAVYFAAFKMYDRAGNMEKKGLAKQQFPLISEIFIALKEEGQTMICGCWINEEVVIRRR